MCGRFISIAKKEKIKKIFNVNKINNFSNPSYNICPQEHINVIFIKNSELIVDTFRWGYSYFNNFNQKEQIVINSRLETINSKLLFRDSYLRRKCVVIANGYFEWKNINGKKNPYFISVPEKENIYFAAIWRVEEKNNKKIFVCCLVTREANERIKDIHNRMPFILSSNETISYLSDKTNKFIKEFKSSEIENDLDFYAISNKINNPKNNYKECLRPLN